MSIHKPKWFSDKHIVVSTAPTCGLTKGGRLLPLVDKETGKRVQVTDPETGEFVDAINDKLLVDMEALNGGKETDTLRFIDIESFDIKTAVPTYYDRRFDEAFHEEMEEVKFKDFYAMTLGDMVDQEMIEINNGHGSPSADQRVGDVPYIKVSDLRAGLVNINPTNRVPEQVAKTFWKKGKPDLKAFDILSPERTSKNIGDFCVLMPGQERVLLTKEIIVMRPGKNANFDSFYLIWAMSLKIVRDQWKRVIFMQTNREDVGKRYYEISIPVPKNSETASFSSESFRDYYIAISQARSKLSDYLNISQAHHFFVSGTEHEKEDEMHLSAAKAPDDE